MTPARSSRSDPPASEGAPPPQGLCRPSPIRDMEVQDLAGRRGLGGAPLDPEETGLSPHQAHHALHARAEAHRSEEGLYHRVRIHGAYPGTDEEPQTWLAGFPLVLHQLIVGRAATEPSGQHLLEHRDHVSVEEAHSAGGELLEAPDLPEVRRPPELLERALASPSRHRRAIAHRDVQQGEGRRCPERREQQGIRRKTGPGAGVVRARLDHRHQVVEQVHVVGRLGREAPVPDRPGLDDAVTGLGVRSGSANRRQPGRRDRLAGEREVCAAEIEPGGRCGMAETGGRAREREQVGPLPSAQHVEHPAGDRERLVEGHVLR